MLTYLGNCSEQINWSDVLKEIENKEPGYIGPRQQWDDPSVAFITKVWKEAGYKPATEGGTAEWGMYFPGVHFSMDVVDTFVKFVGLSSWNSAWISKIRPGYCAPLHVDLQADVKIESVRIHCHIDVPDPGHILIVDDVHLINQKQGETYKWNNPKAWHAASNIGKTPAYLFNIY